MADAGQAAGPVLLWLLPWTDDTPLALPELGRFFIEICRRVRLAEVDGRLVARTGPSNAARIESGETKGVVDDPWTPTHKTDAKSLTVDARGFSWRVVHGLLMGEEWRPPTAQERHDGDPGEPFSRLLGPRARPGQDGGPA
ncbi:MAG: hypothetical protein R3F60_11880 [bacterium]